MKNTIWTGLGLGLSLWVIVGCKPVRPTHDFLADNIRFAANQYKAQMEELEKSDKICIPRTVKPEPLSAREKEIIVCVVKGMTNKQIADALCISAHTVITHRRNIAAKLQIHSAAGLTIYAIVNKLVELSEIKDTITDPQP